MMSGNKSHEAQIKMSQTKDKAVPRSFDDFCRELKYRLRNLPPKSRFSLEVVTNAQGEIHNHRFEQAEDKGPLTVAFN